MAVRAISRAMETAKAIAESDKIPDQHKTELTRQVLQAANSQCAWDNWAQRFVAGGLVVIGLAIAVFVGVAVLKGTKDINAALTSALTAAIGGLAGMFTQKSGGGGGQPQGDGQPQGGAQPQGDGRPQGGTQPAAAVTN